MDSNSDGDRQVGNEIENMDQTVFNMENIEESMKEEVPLILNPQCRDIFPMIGNMLDIKSLTKLSSTSREMYERCTTDRGISTKIKENMIVVRPDDEGQPTVEFHSFVVSDQNMESYLEMLRSRSSCRLTLECLIFTADLNSIHRLNEDFIHFTHRYLEEIGVYSIKKFIVNAFVGWPVLPKFIQDFEIQNLKTFGFIADVELRPILKLNMNSWIHDNVISAKTLLDVVSPIPELDFGRVTGCGENTFKQILWKLQTGPLLKLVMSFPDVDFTNLQTIPFDYDGDLPEERLLVFRMKSNTRTLTYWFLHWTNGVTKCHAQTDRMGNVDHFVKLVLYKCPPSELPPILKPKREVFKQLREEERQVLCSFAHFKSYFKEIPVIDSDYKLRLPKERPLIFKEDETKLWLLKKDDFVKGYEWKEGVVHIQIYDVKEDITTHKFRGSVLPRNCGHRIMMKHFFKRVLLCEGIDYVEPHSQDLEMFLSWFEDFPELPFDYRGPLPKERPLLFSKTKTTKRGQQKKIFVILLEDGTVKECTWDEERARLRDLAERPHKLPSILISSDVLKEIIQKAPFHDGQVKANDPKRPPKRFEYFVELEVFRKAFDELKPLPCDYDGFLPEGRPVIYEKTVKLIDDGLIEVRYIAKEYFVTKAIWKEGIVTFMHCHNGEMPVPAKKALIMKFLKRTWNNLYLNIREFYLDADVFSSCLNELQPLPHDFRGPLPAERPLFFSKTEVKHECEGETSCGCSRRVMRIWSLCEDDSTMYCSFGEKERDIVSFPAEIEPNLVPPVLRTKEHFKYLMERKWPANARPLMKSIRFYGEHSVFINYFNSKRFARVPRGHEGAFPTDRPLIVAGRNTRWMIREDSKVIECCWVNSSYAEIFLSYRSRVPNRGQSFREQFLNMLMWPDFLQFQNII